MRTTNFLKANYRRLLPILATALAISAFFVANQPITPQLALVSSISVVLFALPSYWLVVRMQGRARGVAILTALGFYALIIESSALATGFPYGDFTYTNVLGNKILGLTPWTVAFAYPPILLLAYSLARTMLRQQAHSWRSVIAIAGLTGIIAMVCDLVLDPAAVKLGFWFWDQPGWYYGVPWVNFAGWILSSAVGAVLLHILWGASRPPAGIAYSGLAIIWFWTLVNLWLGQWLPCLIGLLLIFFMKNQLMSKSGVHLRHEA